MSTSIPSRPPHSFKPEPLTQDTITRPLQLRDVSVKIELLKYEMGKSSYIAKLFNKLGISENAKTLNSLYKQLQTFKTPLPDTPEETKTLLQETEKKLKDKVEEHNKSNPYDEKATKNLTSEINTLMTLVNNLKAHLENKPHFQSPPQKMAQGVDSNERLNRLQELRSKIKQLKNEAKNSIGGYVALALGIGKAAATIKEETIKKRQMTEEAIRDQGSLAAVKELTAPTVTANDRNNWSNSKTYLNTLPSIPNECQLGIITTEEGKFIVSVIKKQEEWGDKWGDKYRDQPYEHVELIDSSTFLEAATVTNPIKSINQFPTIAENIKASFKTACGKNEPVFIWESTPPTLTGPAENAIFVTDKTAIYSDTVSANGLDTTLQLQAKGYLEENEHAADWATVDTIGNLTLAVVSDAAGNTEDSHQQVKDDTNRFKSLLMSQISSLQKDGILSLEALSSALSQAFALTELTRSGAKSTAMTCALICETANGEKYAVGICIGDARAMVKYADGSAKDLTPTDFSRGYSDSANSFGTQQVRVVTPQIIFEKLDSGDTLLLGSDCFGDNMEPKTLGKTPLGALQELSEANKLINHTVLQDLLTAATSDQEHWLNTANSPKYWMGTSQGSDKNTPEALWMNSLTPEQKQFLQDVHTLYSEHILSEMQGSNIASDMHIHCTSSVDVRGGILRQELGAALKLASKKATEGKQLNKKEYETVVAEAQAPIAKTYLQRIKAIAIELISQEQFRHLDELWNQNPNLAIDWLEANVGKPDDYSLITITVKSSEAESLLPSTDVDSESDEYYEI